ncbi:Uncharacterized protein Fot_32767 [Forsythia ovata]|uniref:Uncharacterized protein n=1 Tax=Forsythia ovata TaxID=205694 RepID=A0ABD1T950_9LAMI
MRHIYRIVVIEGRDKPRKDGKAKIKLSHFLESGAHSLLKWILVHGIEVTLIDEEEAPKKTVEFEEAISLKKIKFVSPGMCLSDLEKKTCRKILVSFSIFLCCLTKCQSLSLLA